MVRAGADGVEWRCEQCGTWNALGLVNCASCGHAFGRERSSGTPRDPRTTGWLIGTVVALAVLAITVILMLATG
jgi:hypothetical protein